MRKTFIALAAVAALGATIFWGRGAQAMKVKLHAKDLPEHGLRIILPSDPSFDGRMNALLKGRAGEATEILKPFSFIVDNKGPRNAVAYMIEWCFTGAGGDDECYRQAYTSPAALMEGEPPVPDEMEEQSNHIKPNRARLFSLLNPDGSGTFRVPASAEEAGQIKAGAGIDRQALLRRYGAELAKYTDITVAVDGVFFDDGTFAGDDTTGFFAMVKAEVDARRDLLNDMALGLSQLGRSKEEVFRYVETVANQPDVEISSGATPAEFYNFYKKFYAAQTLRTRGPLGDEKALAVALHPLKKTWPRLEKRPKAK
jgi:hypothetical protein